MMALEHAAITRSSLLLKFRPDFIHMDRLIHEKI